MFDIEAKLSSALDPERREWLGSRFLYDLLCGYPDVNAYSRDQDVIDEHCRVSQRLLDEGWEAVGAGAYSLVLRHPEMPGKVLKLVIEDDESTSWVEYCADRQGQPFVPVIHAYGEVLGFPFVVMDELVQDLDRARYYSAMANDIYWSIQEEEYERDLWDYPEFADLVRDACDMGELDIHSGNILFHPVTGEPFLTDPII